jgi:hypothetical protein
MTMIDEQYLASGTAPAEYEDVIRAAVREAMRAPELIRSQAVLSDAERAELIAGLHELRALLQRLLVAVTRG